MVQICIIILTFDDICVLKSKALATCSTLNIKHGLSLLYVIICQMLDRRTMKRINIQWKKLFIL